MRKQLGLVQIDIHAMGPTYQPSPQRRTLGGAIFLMAIDDYRSMDDYEHKDAARFLYPTTREWQNQYEWAFALTEGLNPAWLRDSLDRWRVKWDRQRRERRALDKRRRARHSDVLLRGRKANDARLRGIRTCDSGQTAASRDTRADSPVVQPPRAASAPWADDAAASI
jgi:hypothetical protein